MPYEVCYRALLSISVVEGLRSHTVTHTSHTTLRPPPRAGAPCRLSCLVSVTNRIHVHDSSTIARAGSRAQTAKARRRAGTGVLYGRTPSELSHGPVTTAGRLAQ